MKDYRRRTYIKRGLLPGDGTPFTGVASLSKEVKRQLKEFDSRIELHGNGSEIDVYRVKLYGCAPSEDLLVFQLTLQSKTSVLEQLKKMDTWRTYSPKRSVELQLQNMDEADRIVERNRKLRISELSQHMAKDMFHVISGRTAVSPKPVRQNHKWLEWDNVSTV